MKTRLYIFLLIPVMVFTYNTSKAQHPKEQKINIIFETDMGNDIDDALALDILYKYLDADKINLLGISINKDNKYAPLFIDIMNNWYGYPRIPIAIVQQGIEDPVPANFAAQTYKSSKFHEYRGKNQSPDQTFIESTQFYREILSRQEDNSVIIISVGYLTNLARLLDTKGDDISSLTGQELVSKKVKMLSVMGGNFNGINPQEYNIVKDIPSSKKVFEEWPSAITVSPFEVGNQILYPGETIEKNLNYTTPSPLVFAYKSYNPMPYNRPTWDLTNVLEVVEDGSKYFSYSKKGKITITESGESHFQEDANGKHQYLIISDKQAQHIRKRFIELISLTKSKNQL